jgi:hypothetical protein
MAARKQLNQKARTTEKVKSAQLLNSLHNNALGKSKTPLTASQIRCHDIWLSYHVPKLSALAVEAEIDHEITIKWQK